MAGKRGNVLIIAGLLCVAAALSLAVFNFYGSARAQKSASRALEQLDGVIPPPKEENRDAKELAEAFESGEYEIADYILNPDMDMPTKNIDGRDYIGVLEIPSLGLTLPVLSELSGSGLKAAPCRYKGTAYKDDMIIAAHNYSSHFGNLGELREGDGAVFTDIDGNEFKYTVAEVEFIDGTAVEQMEAGEWDLTLFTCNLSGKSRVTVRLSRRFSEEKLSKRL